MNSGLERREYLRADLDAFVGDGISGSAEPARLTNISERGVHFLRPKGAAPYGTRTVLVEFNLPQEDKPLRVTGRVVYERDSDSISRIGIEFTALDMNDANRIRRYVVRRKRAELFDSLRKEHLGISVG